MIEFELRSIDRALLENATSAGPPAPGVTFVPTGALEASPAADLFLGEEEATSDAREMFTAAVNAVRGSPLGDVTFEDVFVAGPRGLVIDYERRVVWWGEALGWSLASVRLDVERNLAGTMPDERTVVLDDRLFAQPRRRWSWPWGSASEPQAFDHLHLLAIPGIGVYGHWLIDLLPRLLRIGAGEVPAGATVYAPKVKRWAKSIARRAQVDLSGPALAEPGSVVPVRRADVQTLIKRRHVLDRSRAASAWAVLDRSLCGEADEDLSEYGEKLYVSRGRWKAGRALDNHVEIEEFMRRRGYAVIHPETLSLPAQREVFSRARRVVGEDGSGLHNIIFAEPGLTMTVIDLHRTNIFHASIANVKYQHVVHLPADEVDDGWCLPQDRLADHLDAYD